MVKPQYQIYMSSYTVDSFISLGINCRGLLRENLHIHGYCFRVSAESAFKPEEKLSFVEH